MQKRYVHPKSKPDESEVAPAVDGPVLGALEGKGSALGVVVDGGSVFLILASPT